MFEFHGNTLCIQGGWLIESGILSKVTYQNLTLRNSLRVVRRACRGTAALVEFDSMRSDIKAKVIEITGDPHKAHKKTTFKDYLINDLEAVRFFNNYTLDSGEALPQKNIAEYVANAIVLNAIHEVVSFRKARRANLGGRQSQIWETIADIIQDLPKHTYPHSLPNNVRRLKEKYKSYKTEGYSALIHKGFCNKNSEKINDQAKLWVIARWADRVQKVANTRQLLAEYNAKAKVEGWKELKEETTLYLFLHSEENQPLWYGHRYGEKRFDEKFMYQHKTALPSMRDSLWYSDGTKLNYYYLDANGKVATISVYEVMDSYSEVLLGYHISPTEDFEAQYNAYKMAVKTSGHRPYQIGFDNQGGHKKLEAGSFLSKLARLTIKSQPYNGKSKSIESAFGRFQQQFLKKDWFFTGQNITAKKDESKANLEFILANKKNLPTLEDIKKIYEQRRNEWNQAMHPKTGIARMEMYRNSVNPETPAIEIWDMVDLFWITRPKAVMCTAAGIEFTEKKVQYSYMVHDENGYPDFTWLKKNIDKKFIIKFEPDDMSLIHLFEETPNGLRHVTAATTKVEIHRGKQEQIEGEASWIKEVENRKKLARVESRDEADAILEAHGMLPEQYGLNSPVIKGIESRRKKRKEAEDLGELQKQISNAINPLEDEDEDPNLVYIRM